MSGSVPDLFAASESYLNSDIEFDHLYEFALQVLPESHALDPDSPVSQLATLIVAIEAERGEFSDSEQRTRLRDFLAVHTAGRPR